MGAQQASNNRALKRKLSSWNVDLEDKDSPLTLQYKYNFIKLDFVEEWATALFPDAFSLEQQEQNIDNKRKNSDVLITAKGLHINLLFQFISATELDLSLELEFRRRHTTEIMNCWDLVRRRFRCTYEVSVKMFALQKVEETMLAAVQMPSKVKSTIFSYLFPPSEHNLIAFGDALLQRFRRCAFDISKSSVTLPESNIFVKPEVFTFHPVGPLKLRHHLWRPTVKEVPFAKKEFAYDDEEDSEEIEIPLPTISAQTDGLLITFDLPPESRRLTLRIARFGADFEVYDWKTGRLVKSKGAAIPCYRAKTTSVKIGYGEDQLEPSTQYAVKYSVLVGKKWSKRSSYMTATTSSSMDKPSAPVLEPIPSGFRINLPKLPPNAQHLTLWVLKNDVWNEYRVYDWKTKQVVPQEGSAVPVWDTGKYLDVTLEPCTKYTIKYSLMQEEEWRTCSEGATETTLPEKKSFTKKLFGPQWGYGSK